MKRIILMSIIGSLVSCNSSESNGNDSNESEVVVSDTTQNESTTEEVMEDEAVTDGYNERNFEIPGYTIMDHVVGDLNKDGTDETVVIYDTGIEGEIGTKRELVIWQMDQGVLWEKWYTSKTVVLGSEGGGMMGDPYDFIEINKGVLSVHHWGGSSWKWNYTHKFRYQDGDFHCIGASTHYGKPCEYWDFFDYNLSTGNIEVTHTDEDCSDENETKETEHKEQFKSKLDKLPKLSEFTPGETEVTRPGTKEVYYF